MKNKLVICFCLFVLWVATLSPIFLVSTAVWVVILLLQPKELIWGERTLIFSSAVTLTGMEIVRLVSQQGTWLDFLFITIIIVLWIDSIRH